MKIPTPNPEAYGHVVGLRVVRRYLDRPLPRAELEAILEAARWTGSSKNDQGWAFVVVEGAEALQRLATAGTFTVPVAQSVVTVCLVRLPGGHDFDIGRVAQNLMLAAAARGIESCPVTLHLEDRATEVLDLPADHHCRWVVALGYADPEAEAEGRATAKSRGMSGRRNLADVIHRGEFGA